MTAILLQDLIDHIYRCILRACSIMAYHSTQPSLKFKEGYDPVTSIDHTIQFFLLQNLNLAFPGIKIVGEEDIEEDMIDYTLLNFQNDLKGSFPKKFIDKKGHYVNLEEICIFIDPLDGTRGFVYGKKWESTILIGVTLNGQPIIGAIGQPFKQSSDPQKNNGNTYYYSPSILFGGKFLKNGSAIELSYQSLTDEFNFKVIQNCSNGSVSLNKAAISSRRNCQQLEKVIKKLQLKKQSYGGSGNKLGKLIRGEVDCVIFLQAPTSTWDSCAGQAIITGMNGFFFKPDLSFIKYDHTKSDQLNREGFIACLNGNLSASIQKQLLTP